MRKEISRSGKRLILVGCTIHTPPVSLQARRELGRLIRRVQRGLAVEFPASRPMTDIGSQCHELRVNDAEASWRVIYRIDSDAVVIVEVFSKKTPRTPDRIIKASRQRLAAYDAAKQAH